MNPKELKTISLIAHASMLVLGIIFPSLSLVFLALSMILPLSYFILSTFNDTSKNKDISFDTIVFASHTIVISLARLLPSLLLSNLFVLNTIASLHYVAHFINWANSPVIQVAAVSVSDWCPDFIKSVADDFTARNLAKNATVSNILNASIV